MAKTKYDPFGDTIEKEEKPKKEAKPDQGKFSRQTFIVRDEYLEKLKAKAYWDRTTQKDLLDEALQAYFNDKKVKPIPDKA